MRIVALPVLITLLTLVTPTSSAQNRVIDLGGVVISVSDSRTAQVFHIVDQMSQWDSGVHHGYVRTLVLPEMSFHSPDVVFCYGCEAAEKEKGVMPGEVVELKILGGDFYDWIKSRIAENGSESRISKAEIRNMYVTLPTGPILFSGCVKTANPRNACPRSAPAKMRTP
jgi:hypothetical protein